MSKSCGSGPCGTAVFDGEEGALGGLEGLTLLRFGRLVWPAGRNSGRSSGLFGTPRTLLAARELRLANLSLNDSDLTRLPPRRFLLISLLVLRPSGIASPAR